jgi:hypothetical protein
VPEMEKEVVAEPGGGARWRRGCRRRVRRRISVGGGSGALN